MRISTSLLLLRFPSIPLFSYTMDKTIFRTTLPLLSLKINAKDTSKALSLLTDVYSFQRPRMKRVVEAPPPDNVSHRLILLSESIFSISDLPIYDDLSKQIEIIDVIKYNLELGYENLSVDEVLRKVLPSGIDIPSSFEQVGHIAHLNLRDEMLPFKETIGQVIIDKTPAIKTVVNKIGNIENEFRTFPMEVIAGITDFNVQVRESNAKFSFDFSKVYWNSRLQMEHSRLVDFILQRKNRIVIADMMAGVGPFAIPLAIRIKTPLLAAKSKVFANDLNPSSHEYLTQNSRGNNCTSHIECFNSDARQFMSILDARGVKYSDVIMNLPQNAIDFLDVFIGCWSKFTSSSKFDAADIIDNGKDSADLPCIHVYAFSSEEDPLLDVRQRIASALKCDENLIARTEKWTKKSCLLLLSSGEVSYGHVVRDVAPKKVMVCFSFRLPIEVANCSKLTDSIDEADGDTKRQRLV